MRQIPLETWNVVPTYPYRPFQERSVETGTPLSGMFDPISVRVPGSLYQALMDRGIIEDVRVRMNSIKAEWVKDRWWLYETTVDFQPEEFTRIRFEGVDYHCHVFVNGIKVAEHVGALVPFEADITAVVRPGKNEIKVCVENAPFEMGQIGRTDLTFTQRPRFDNKWDFCARLINIGIYRPVRLITGDGSSIRSMHFRVFRPASRGEAEVHLELSAELAGKHKISAEIFDDTSVCATDTIEQWLSVGENKAVLHLCVPEVKLWEPNGQGIPNCYTLRIRLERDNKTSDILEQTVGFRDFSMEQNENAPDGALPYTFCINGRKFYARGFNITPLDLMLGNDTPQRYEVLVRAAAEAHANIIRVWGGGIIEQPSFYEYCSRFGILVWQDMVQSSSGLSNVPSEIPEFLSMLEESTAYAVKTRRNYPCTAIICGGNELFGRDGRPVTVANANIARIASIVRKEAPELYFVPSTSSGPTQEADLVHQENNHDIHGPWLYLGNVAQYEHFNRLQCLFAAEFGCEGMASVEQLRYLFDDDDPPVSDIGRSVIWRHHGEWWDPKREVSEIFHFEDLSLSEYVQISQFLQACGLFYAITALRRQAFRQSGCLVWQLNEMFPNFSCTTLIEYSGRKKLAYEAAKKAFDRVVISFRAEKLAYYGGERVLLQLYVTDDGEEKDGEVFYRVDGNLSGSIAEGRATYRVGCGKSSLATEISFTVPQADGVVRVYVYTDRGGRFESEWIIPVLAQNGYADAQAVIRILQQKNE